MQNFIAYASNRDITTSIKKKLIYDRHAMQNIIKQRDSSCTNMSDNNTQKNPNYRQFLYMINTFFPSFS